MPSPAGKKPRGLLPKGRVLFVKGVSCAILVGGESKRIGRDKAKVKFSASTLFGRVFDVVSKIFPDIMVSAHTPDYSTSELKKGNLRLISDTLPGRGPALGVVSALENAKNPWVFVLACDTPMASGKLIRALSGKRRGYDCVVPQVGGRLEPLFALYRKTCLKSLSMSVKEGKRSLGGFLEKSRGLKVRYVGESELEKVDPDFERSFMDVDTMDELKEAESKFKRGVKKG